MVLKPTKKGLEIGFALPEGFEDERLLPAKTSAEAKEINIRW